MLVSPVPKSQFQPAIPSGEFERSVNKVFKKSYDNLPPETIALIKQALGSRIPMEKNAH